MPAGQSSARLLGQVYRHGRASLGQEDLHITKKLSQPNCISRRNHSSSSCRFDSEYHICFRDSENPSYHAEMRDEYTERRILCSMRFPRQVPELINRDFGCSYKVCSVKQYSVDQTIRPGGMWGEDESGIWPTTIPTGPKTTFQSPIQTGTADRIPALSQ